MGAYLPRSADWRVLSIVQEPSEAQDVHGVFVINFHGVDHTMVSRCTDAEIGAMKPQDVVYIKRYSSCTCVVLNRGVNADYFIR